jgi:uncharacterized protein (DUF427 family)
MMSRMEASETLKKAAHAAGAHRITTNPSTRHVRVESDGLVLAESDRAIELHETGLPTRFYLPREDVRMELLTPTETTSYCPFKGDATYFSAPSAPDAFWVYEAPSEEDAKPIAGLLAPWPGRVEVIIDGERE